MVWNLNIPPRIHVFLWLMSNNKILVRNNLAKRQHVNDKTCLLCGEDETVAHLFFECVVAQRVWSEVSDFLGLDIGENFELVAKLLFLAIVSG